MASGVQPEQRRIEAVPCSVSSIIYKTDDPGAFESVREAVQPHD